MFPNDTRSALETPKKRTDIPVKTLRLLKPPPAISVGTANSVPSAEPSKLTTASTRLNDSPKLVTPLKARSRPPGFLPRDSTTPARTTTPFRALALPVLREDGTGEEEDDDVTAKLKKLPAPNFGLVSKDAAKMTAVTALDVPAMDMMQMGDFGPVGEKLELERGLLVSPEKGNKRKGRFLR